MISKWTCFHMSCILCLFPRYFPFINTKTFKRCIYLAKCPWCYSRRFCTRVLWILTRSYMFGNSLVSANLWASPLFRECKYRIWWLLCRQKMSSFMFYSQWFSLVKSQSNCYVNLFSLGCIILCIILVALVFFLHYAVQLSSVKLSVKEPTSPTSLTPLKLPMRNVSDN